MLPPWLALGLAISAVLAVVFAVVFAVGERLFPTRPVERGGDYGEAKRRAEIRAYLAEAGERWIENDRVGDVPVAFYLPERDVSITFDAHDYFRLEALGTYPVLVEHEMPGAHLGARLPFETPKQKPADGASVDGGVGDAYGVLGVDAGASETEVTAAYREKIKEVHPDHGGDERQFRAVQDAYAVAKRAASGAQSSSETS